MLFLNAKIIIGPTGASWTNIIFSKKGTKALMWMNMNWGNFPVFSTFAAIMGVDLYYIPTIDCELNVHGKYTLETDVFKLNLETLIDKI